MSSASRSSLPLSEKNSLARRPRAARLLGVELFAIGWESISGLLFATAVSPAVVARPWPSLIFVGVAGGERAAGALAGATEGRAKYWALDLLRAVAWPSRCYRWSSSPVNAPCWEPAPSVSWPPALGTRSTVTRAIASRAA